MDHPRRTTPAARGGRAETPRRPAGRFQHGRRRPGHADEQARRYRPGVSGESDRVVAAIGRRADHQLRVDESRECPVQIGGRKRRMVASGDYHVVRARGTGALERSAQPLSEASSVLKPHRQIGVATRKVLPHPGVAAGPQLEGGALDPAAQHDRIVEKRLVETGRSLLSQNRGEPRLGASWLRQLGEQDPASLRHVARSSRDGHVARSRQSRQLGRATWRASESSAAVSPCSRAASAKSPCVESVSSRRAMAVVT